jgi:peptidoglycan/LPS O-acetylase OafA/YrhL
MGIYRVVLALSVVILHANPLSGFYLLNPAQAVESFFVISGFYMALILNEKYVGAGSYRLFITNRLLRIYPIYWCVLFMTVAAWVASALCGGDVGPLSIYGQSLGWPAQILLHLSNLFLIGQDWVMFLGVKGHHLYVVRGIGLTNPELWKFLYIPPAWSLGVELTFYAIAPWLVRRSARVIFMMVLASLALHLVLAFGLHLTRDPWSYRFFPNELGLFLAGALAYRIYRYIDSKRLAAAVHRSVMGGFLLMVLAYQLIPISHGIKHLALYIVAWCALPFLFLATRKSKIDRYIGELSYPIYIGHWFVIMFLPVVFRWLGIHFSPILIVHLMLGPIERFRQRRYRNARANALADEVVSAGAAVPAG